MEELMVSEIDTEFLKALPPRHVQVVVLVGGRGLSYKAAAAQMQNKNVRVRGDQEPPQISFRTVETYAATVRDKLGSRLSPKRALTEFYYAHREELLRIFRENEGGDEA